jgi:hypothetical protein
MNGFINLMREDMLLQGMVGFAIGMVIIFIYMFIALIIEDWKEQNRKFKDDPYNYPPHNVKSFLRYLKRKK